MMEHRNEKRCSEKVVYISMYIFSYVSHISIKWFKHFLKIKVVLNILTQAVEQCRNFRHRARERALLLGSSLLAPSSLLILQK